MLEIAREIVAKTNCPPEVNMRPRPVDPVEEAETPPVPRPRSFLQQTVGTFERTSSLRVPPSQSTAGLAPSPNQEIQKIMDMLQVAQTELKEELSNQTKETRSQNAQLKTMHDNLKEELESMIRNHNDDKNEKLNKAMQKILQVEMDVSALKKYFDQKINRRSKKLMENTNECLLMLATMVDKELEKIQQLRESEKKEIERNLERKMEDMVSRMVEQKISELRFKSEESNTLTPISSSEFVWSEDSFDENHEESFPQPPEVNSEQPTPDLDSEEEESRKIEEEFRKRLADQNQAFEHRFNSVRARRNQVNRDVEEELTTWRRRFIRNSPDRCSLQEGRIGL